MKDRMFRSLLLSAVFALPGLAQQTGSISGTQPVTTAGQTAPASQDVDTSRPKLEPPTPAGFWDGEDPNLANLVAHPFASKKYVKRQIQPIQDRLNELDELANSHAQIIKAGDARANHDLELVSIKVKDADQHAIDAGSKAETAKMTATQTTTRVATAEQLVGNVDEYKNRSQTEILFRPGQSALSKQAKDTLDEMAAPLKDQHNYFIEVQAFAPGHGQAAIGTSRMMADSVVRYMVLEHKIPVYRVYVLALGDASAAPTDKTGARRPGGGRVEVNLFKNDLLSSAH
jgi:outer membrane protein OmpA-like peptidoglycan-associated protein